MAKRKLAVFSADEADDEFTPSVKTIQGGEIETPVEPTKPAAQRTQRPVKVAKGKTAKAKKPSKPKAEKPSPPAKAATPEPEKAPEPTKAAPPAPKPEVAPVQSSPPPAPAVSAKETAIDQAIRQKQETPSIQTFEIAQDKKGSDELIQMVGFCLGDEEFGVDIQEIHEINRTVEITPVPRTPPFVEGVINLRGKVVPVINMRTRFQLPLTEKTSQTRIVIVEIDGKIVGMLVDSVTEVLRIPASTIEPPPDIISGIDAEYIRGVAKLQDRLLILLDLGKILSNVKTQ